MGDLFAAMAASLNKPVRILDNQMCGTVVSRGLDGLLEIQIYGSKEIQSVRFQDVEFMAADEFEQIKTLLEIMQS